MFVDVQDRIELEWETGPAAGLSIAVNVHSHAAEEAAERFVRRLRAGRLSRKDVTRFAAVFVEHVLEWSVVDRWREPVPVSLKAFVRMHGDRVVRPVLEQWAAAVLNPPAGPELEQSSDTEQFDTGLVLEDSPAEPDDGIDHAIEDWLSVRNLSAPDDTETLISTPEHDQEPAELVASESG